jgi:hypothetical protein
VNRPLSTHAARLASALATALLSAAALSLGGCSDSGPPPVIESFRTSTDTLFAGGSTWLYFKATGATSLRIDPGIGDVTGQTSMPAGPAETTTYTLTASNAGGSVKASLTLTVIPRAAQLGAFTATPDSVVAGKPVLLKWSAVDAVALQLTASPTSTTPLPALTAKATQVEVTPAVSTVYTLTVIGPAGTRQPPPRSAAVVVGQLPVVALNADATSVARGGAVLLTWTSSVAAGSTLVSRPHGAATPETRLSLGPSTQARVRPLEDTDYTVEALGPGGTATSNFVSITVTGAAATTLRYVEATPGTADVAALKLRGLAEGGAVATFDLVVLKPITAGALALELPLDGAVAGSREGSVRVALDGTQAGHLTPGLTANRAALDPGASPPAAIAALPAAGPSAGILMVAVAQKPICNTLSCAGGIPADRALTAGTVLASVRLRLQPAGGAGPVFTAGALDAAHGARSVVRSGSGGTSLGTIAVGSLSAQ